MIRATASHPIDDAHVQPPCRLLTPPNQGRRAREPGQPSSAKGLGKTCAYVSRKTCDNCNGTEPSSTPGRLVLSARIRRHPSHPKENRSIPTEFIVL
jgi:hypothetical protein